uniref:Uncharacterized protein n=1 Tax=Timema bartmani TaxID=61472 RepID=A0A7R9F1K1_9NEOP|nr:unnamed protein product [Timema bartmani]
MLPFRSVENKKKPIFVTGGVTGKSWDEVLGICRTNRVESGGKRGVDVQYYLYMVSNVKSEEAAQLIPKLLVNARWWVGQDKLKNGELHAHIFVGFVSQKTITPVKRLLGVAEVMTTRPSTELWDIMENDNLIPPGGQMDQPYHRVKKQRVEESEEEVEESEEEVEEPAASSVDSPRAVSPGRRMLKKEEVREGLYSSPMA